MRRLKALPAWLTRVEPWVADRLNLVRAGLEIWLGAVRREYHGLSWRTAAERIRREVLVSPARGRAAYALAVLALASFAVWSRLIVPLAVTPYFRPGPSFEVVAFFENGAGGLFVDSLPALEEAGRTVDTISPFWFSLDGRGEILADGHREKVMELARRLGLKVVPLVTNAKRGRDNSVDAVQDPGVRKRVVDRLAALAAERGYDGLNLGFELLPPEAGAGFVRLTQDLGLALRAEGKVLVVSVYPDVELPSQVSGFFDYRALGEAADYVVLLAYDRHWTATGPGPIAPRPWVEAAVSSLARHVPARKIVLGAGTHAYDWPAEGEAGRVEYLPAYAALQRAESIGADVEMDAASGQAFYEYESDVGAGRVVWLQDADHLVWMARLARRMGLRGLGIWRLGFSEPGALARLAEALGRRP